MEDRLERTRRLIGDAGIEKLASSHVAVFGIGGVGGSAAEALARSGIGELTLIDNDRVNRTNFNRQIIALRETEGMLKTEAMRRRVASISETIQVHAVNCFFLPENTKEVDFSRFDYIVDAVDTVSAKLEIICRAVREGIPVISSMGTGNKMDPSLLTVTDIYRTSGCPLARVMRRELKKRGIPGLKVVYSTETPIKPLENGEDTGMTGRHIPGSSSFVPPAAGLILASQVVMDLLKEEGDHDW